MLCLKKNHSWFTKNNTYNFDEVKSTVKISDPKIREKEIIFKV